VLELNLDDVVDGLAVPVILFVLVGTPLDTFQTSTVTDAPGFVVKYQPVIVPV